MKEEIEIKWVVNLLNASNLSNSFFKKGGGSIRDFEIGSGASFNSKEFRSFFNSMSNLEIIKFSYLRENGKGNPIKIYVLNKNKLFKYLKSFEFYTKFKKVIDENVII